MVLGVQKEAPMDSIEAAPLHARQSGCSLGMAHQALDLPPVARSIVNAGSS